MLLLSRRSLRSGRSGKQSGSRRTPRSVKAIAKQHEQARRCRQGRSCPRAAERDQRPGGERLRQRPLKTGVKGGKEEALRFRRSWSIEPMSIAPNLWLKSCEWFQPIHAFLRQQFQAETETS